MNIKSCRVCGSYAINEHLHGRIPGAKLDLCDVCYWRDVALEARVSRTKWNFMTKQEAIERAKEINKEERDLHQPDITHVAMGKNGLWYGYDQEPIFDDEQGEWDGWNWEIPLFEVQDDSVVIDSVSEI